MALVLVLGTTGTVSCGAGTSGRRVASAAAQSLLSTLTDLPSRQTGRSISGQFAGDGEMSGVAALQASTGYWVGLVGEDYYSPGVTDADTSVNAQLIDYWRQGGLVTLSCHMGNPHTGGLVRDRDVDLQDVLTPGTPTHTAFTNAVDEVARGLRELRDAGVVVLFRPFHEMNGDWFWWGARDPGQFKALWRDVHEHLTRDLGLDNLLFVYSPNHGPRVMDYYPGDAYVDVVAVDYYGNHPTSMRTSYDSLISTGKPFAVGEFGPGGPSTADVPSDWDFRRLLDAIKTTMPRTVWWQAWSGVWGMQNGSHVSAVLGDPWVLNRSRVP